MKRTHLEIEYDSSTPFFTVPDDIIQYAIAGRLGLQSLGLFCQTSHRMYQLLQKPARAAKLLYLIKKYVAESHNNNDKEKKNYTDILNMVKNNPPSIIVRDVSYQKLDGTYEITSPLKLGFITIKNEIWSMFYEKVKNTNELENFIKQLNEVKEDIPWGSYPPADLERIRKLCSQHPELSNVIPILDALMLCKLIIRSAKFAEAKEKAAANPPLMFQNFTLYNRSRKTSPLKFAVDFGGTDIVMMFYEKAKETNTLESFIKQLNEIEESIWFSTLSDLELIKKLCLQHPELSNIIPILDASVLCSLIRDAKFAEAKEKAAANPPLMFQTICGTSPLKEAFYDGEFWKVLYEIIKNNDEWIDHFKVLLKKISIDNDNDEGILLNVKFHLDLSKLFSQLGLGEPGLFKAAEKGDAATVKKFLENGVNPNQKLNHLHDDDQIWMTWPLHLAVRNGHYEVTQLLLDHGAKPNLLNGLNSTPLTLAAKYGHKEVFQLLLSHNADLINHQGDNKDTPLHCAAELGYIDIVRMMLPYQPDLSLQNADGKTALDLTRLNGHDDLAELLENYSANISNDASSSIKKPGM